MKVIASDSASCVEASTSIPAAMSSLDQVVEQVKEFSERAAKAVDEGLNNASHVIKSTSAVATKEAEKAYGEAQVYVDKASGQLKEGEEYVVGKLKEGVALFQAYEPASSAVAAGTALLLIPATRRILYRQTLGRLRSEEAVFRSAERKSKTLAETVDIQSKEAEKLQERVKLAEEEYYRGLSKLKSASSQLQSLIKQVNKTEKNAKGLIRDLRELPSQQALALRAEVAQQKAAAKTQHDNLDRTLYQLVKKGLA